jgi:hypothetical protein
MMVWTIPTVADVGRCIESYGAARKATMSDLVGVLEGFAGSVIEELKLPLPVKVLLLDADMNWLVKLVFHGQLKSEPPSLRKIDIEKSFEIGRRKPPYHVVFDAEGMNPVARDFPWAEVRQALNADT